MVLAQVVHVHGRADPQPRGALPDVPRWRRSHFRILTKLFGIPDLHVDAVVEVDEGDKGQNTGDKDLRPVPAEHDVPLVAQNF